MKNIIGLKNRFLVYILPAFIFLACNSSPVKEMNARKETSPTDSVRNNPTVNVTDPQYENGARLVAGNDCLSCHKINEKSIGPAYIDIANKYEMNQGNIENLAHKIISGGYGRWGTVAMPAHATIEPYDAREMSKYVLSLRKK